MRRRTRSRASIRSRFNLAGYIRWKGRVYLAPKSASTLFRPFIYHGRLGAALFQTLYQKEPSFLLDGPLMIQWYFLWAAILVLSPFSLWLLPVGVALLGVSLWAALLSGLMTEVQTRLTRAQTAKKVWVIGVAALSSPDRAFLWPRHSQAASRRRGSVGAPTALAASGPGLGPRSRMFPVAARS